MSPSCPARVGPPRVSPCGQLAEAFDPQRLLPTQASRPQRPLTVQTSGLQRPLQGQGSHPQRPLSTQALGPRRPLPTSDSAPLSSTRAGEPGDHEDHLPSLWSLASLSPASSHSPTKRFNGLSPATPSGFKGPWPGNTSSHRPANPLWVSLGTLEDPHNLDRAVLQPLLR